MVVYWILMWTVERMGVPFFDSRLNSRSTMGFLTKAETGILN
jgi:hypothetical protein